MQSKVNPLTKNLAFIALLGLFALLSVPLARLSLGSPMLFGEDGLNELRLGRLALARGFAFEDAMTVPSTSLRLDLSNGLLGLLNRVFPGSWMVFIQIALGVLLLAGFWGLMLRLDLQKKLSFISALVLAISPGFVRLFSRPMSQAFPLLLIVWGAYFWVAKGKLIQNIIGVALLGLAMWMGLPWLISIMLFVIGYSIFIRRRITTPIVLGLIAVGAFFGMRYTLHFSPIPLVEIANRIAFELGGVGALSLGCVILGIIGIFLTWGKSRGLAPCYALVVFALLDIALFSGQGGMLLILFPGLSGFMLDKLFSKTWAMPVVKYSTYTFAFMLLILSMGIAIAKSVDDVPNGGEYSALLTLRELGGGVTLSAPRYSSAVQAIAEKPVLLFSDPKAANASRIIFSSQTLRRTLPPLSEYNISYILITRRMIEQGDVENGKGLMFLLRNNETFKKLYDVNGIQVWGVLRQP
jgi:hypothetical protein